MYIGWVFAVDMEISDQITFAGGRMSAVWNDHMMVDFEQGVLPTER